MNLQFPAAVPEIPVSDLEKAVAYYKSNLGFSIDWGATLAELREFQEGRAECILQPLLFGNITTISGQY